MANKVIMPKQGLQMTEGLITKWLVPEGSDVGEGDPLFEMETDKLSITMDSGFTGTLLKILKREGETVPITETIAIIGEKGENYSDLLTDDEISDPAATGEKERSNPTAINENEIPDPTAIAEKVIPNPTMIDGSDLAPAEQRNNPEESNTSYAQVKGKSAFNEPDSQPGDNRIKGNRIFATPRAKWRLEEKSIKMNEVDGTGPDGPLIEIGRAHV